MTNNSDTWPVLSSGNREMDVLLNGGFPQNSINIIMGLPGTGKTIFSEQLVFHHAREDDRPVLYLSTLSEPLAKVLTYLQRFSFYDEDKIGSSVKYEDLGAQLSQHGLEILAPKLVDAIHTIEPKIIVIDSFKALHDLSESTSSMRRVLHQITSLLTAYDTTVFLVGEYTNEQAELMPEFAIADGIVQFLRNPLSTRDERFVRILKLRGSQYHEGLHGFRVTENGLEVFPRLVSPQFPTKYVFSTTRVKSGISGLDELLAGGFVQGRTALLAGPSGSGKTTAALQFVIEGVKTGAPGLYINFQENPTQIVGTIAALGQDAESLLQNGLHLLYESPVELQIDSVIVRVFNMVQEHGIKRVAIDALGDFVMAAGDTSRSHDFLYALNQQLNASGITSMLTYETIPNSETAAAHERFSYMCDAYMLLGLDCKSKIKRTLTIWKQRASNHALGVFPMEITSSGMAVSKIAID